MSQEIKEHSKEIIISCFSDNIVDCSEEDRTKCFCSLDLHQVECDLFIANNFLSWRLTLQVIIKQLFNDEKGKSLFRRFLQTHSETQLFEHL